MKLSSIFMLFFCLPHGPTVSSLEQLIASTKLHYIISQPSCCSTVSCETSKVFQDLWMKTTAFSRDCSSAGMTAIFYTGSVLILWGMLPVSACLFLHLECGCIDSEVKFPFWGQWEMILPMYLSKPIACFCWVIFLLIAHTFNTLLYPYSLCSAIL
jgi:hypothetical protein